MATFTATAAASTSPARQNVNETWSYGEYEISAALVLNDVIEMVNVPKGARILELILETDDLDTNGAPAIVLDVGDGSSTARFIDGSTIGQAGGLDRLGSNLGYRYTAADTIDVLVQVAPATGATSGTIKLAVCYTMEGATP